MIAPTRTMPWIAFVPDISGVCSIVGTFEITSKPTKIARTKMVQLDEELALQLRRRHAGLVVVTHAPAMISSSQSSFELALRRQVLQQLEHVARVQLAGVGRHRARQVRAGRRS